MGLVCLHLLMSTGKPRSRLSIILISNITALELLNAVGFVTAFLGLYLCVKPMRVAVATGQIPAQPMNDLNPLWRLWDNLYFTSNVVFVAGGLLTDGIMVSYMIFFLWNATKTMILCISCRSGDAGKSGELPFSLGLTWS